MLTGTASTLHYVLDDVCAAAIFFLLAGRLSGANKAHRQYLSPLVTAGARCTDTASCYQACQRAALMQGTRRPDDASRCSFRP